VLGALLGVSGCGDSGPREPGEATSIRLYESSIDITLHVPLNKDATHRIEIRYFDDRGDRITSGLDQYEPTITFSPSDLAMVTPVPGSPTFFDLVSTKPNDTPGTMSVSVLHHRTGDVTTHGPFDVLVH